MTSSSSGLNETDLISLSLDMLSKKWDIDPIVRDLHVGKRTDLQDYQIKVNQVTFHIPYLLDPSLFLLWKCLWPDCHNCCTRQGRLPLTVDDITKISKNLGYKNRSDFIKEETYVASWDNNSDNSKLVSTLTMINLKRKNNENENDDGNPISCRFLNDSGSCTLHPDKPGVCWLYPFFSWSQFENNQMVVHASFQLTGDCPGFYLSPDIDEEMKKILNDYSKKIYDYTMNINTTIREGFGRIDLIE
ncbi:MAG: YkgJ family cysteine cluster protein [Candidatus Nitrosocosmicus sp.]